MKCPNCKKPLQRNKFTGNYVTHMPFLANSMEDLKRDLYNCVAFLKVVKKENGG